jgi:hypothetical protein
MLNIRKMSLKSPVTLALMFTIFFACHSGPNGIFNQLNSLARIKPEYSGVTIPP